MRPTGTVTFLFSDIEASTQRLSEIGPQRYGELLEMHRSLQALGPAAAEAAWHVRRRTDFETAVKEALSIK
jgi:hypothetical protein